MEGNLFKLLQNQDRQGLTIHTESELQSKPYP